MCGIVGEWRFDGRPIDADRLLRRTRALAHRGPDGEGIWTEGGIGLGHRRLSIIDLSPSGAQPMLNQDASLIVVFNGEIYNYQELRSQLAQHGVPFRSTSDTEVLLHLYERHGIEMVDRLRGMFAFVIWDRRQQRLFMARDRLGKKPLFYRYTSEGISFASELKALRIDQPVAVDWSALRLFLGLQYVPAPLSGFVGIRCLPPGQVATVTATGGMALHAYHQLSREPKFQGSEAEAAEQVEQLLDEAVRLRLIADVPVGAFLSGGMDSSALVALMARHAGQPFHTFTMGFPSLGFDERAQARDWADHIGSQHHEFEARPGEVVDLVDTLVATYDAPYADSSALPTWLLARETSRIVKVVLTGDGGDELFGGYRRYQALLKAWQWHQRFYGRADRALAQLSKRLGQTLDDPRWQRFGRTMNGLAAGSLAQGYASLFTGAYFSHEDERTLLRPELLAATEDSAATAFIMHHYPEHLGLEGALAFDLHSYLIDDLNVKMDRAAMAHGLEARAPFLDQQLVHFVCHLPLSFILKRGRQKPLLTKALQGIVKPTILHRPKRGFQVPLALWFRRELRPLFVERCLSQASPLLRFCRSVEIERYLAENDRGADHGNRLWMLLVLASWLGSVDQSLSA